MRTAKFRTLSRRILSGALAALLAAPLAAFAAPQELPPAESMVATRPAAQLPDADLLRADAGVDALKPGEFEWQPGWNRAGGAPVTVMVSLREQRAYVYRDGQRIAVSTVSTGRPGRETPTGVYGIIEKQKMHHSNLYDDAPMPWMQRLTMDGIALHAGRIPGHPASHGCVRLPLAFAEQLFSITARGGTVVVSDDGSMEALARAGVDAQLALLIGASASLHELGQALVADDPGAAADGARDRALSP